MFRKTVILNKVSSHASGLRHNRINPPINKLYQRIHYMPVPDCPLPRILLRQVTYVPGDNAHLYPGDCTRNNQKNRQLVIKYQDYFRSRGSNPTNQTGQNRSGVVAAEGLERQGFWQRPITLITAQCQQTNLPTLLV
jgi:hypothetical protein